VRVGRGRRWVCHGEQLMVSGDYFAETGAGGWGRTRPGRPQHSLISLAGDARVLANKWERVRNSA
jgi:hypothetical protein